jgi:Zn-finger nucleic acid-binding protein
MLKCPACQRDLKQHVIEDITVDECKRCGGIWFDAGELDALSPSHIEGIAKEEADFNEDLLGCPVDSNPLLQATLDGVTLHTCMACNGLWLDGLSVDTLLGVLRISDVELQKQNVRCAGCGNVTHRSQSAFRFDSHWCETCVIAGDYPGGTGRTLAKQRTEMALSIGKETQRLQAAKENREGLKALNTQIAVVGSRGLKADFQLMAWLVQKIRG